MQGFELLEPASLDEAVRMLDSGTDGVKLIGGGTALVVLMKQKLFWPARLVSTRRVPELQVLEYQDGAGLRIGGGVRLYDIESSSILRKAYPLLAEAVHKVGNVRVRQMATLAGNLSHGDYMSDPPAALVALDALAVLKGPEGRRELPLEEFILGPYTTRLAPGEVLAEVRVPPAAPGAAGAYLKFAVPSETERPTASVAVQAVANDDLISDIRIVLGAPAGRPLRLKDSETLVRARSLTPDLAREAAEAAAESIEPIDDGRAPVWYKKEISGVLVRRALERVALQLGHRLRGSDQEG